MVSKIGACVLIGELLLVAVFVLGAELIGLINPGGIIMASTILASGSGGFISTVFIAPHS